MFAPSALVAGPDRPPWTVAELDHCSLGNLRCAICAGPVPDSALEALHPDERKYCASLEEWRRREWVGGRLCLAHALSRVCQVRTPLLATPTGAPDLPVGYVGSISHKSQLVVAIAAVGSDGIGIDIEYAEDRDVRLAQRILTAQEMTRLDTYNADAAPTYVAAHFSAKEALYKSLSPNLQAKVDFGEIELGTFPCAPTVNSTWVDVQATVRGAEFVGELMVLFDGPWILAVARRS